MFEYIMAIMLSFTQPNPLPVSQVIAVCGIPSELTLRVDNRIRF
jgi:hypothetical protein